MPTTPQVAAAQLEVGLDPEQLQAVTAPPGPVCVIAGAGTGKTTTLVGRIAHQVLSGNWDAGAVLAVTHSTQAAGNMRDRLLRLAGEPLSPVTAQTYHAFAHRICRENWALSGREHSFSLTDNVYSVVRNALRKRGHRDVESTLVADLTSEISWAKSSLVSADRYAKAAAAAGRAVNSMSPSQVASVYREYDKQLAALGTVDFSDLLVLAADILMDPRLPSEVRDRYRHVLVDEFQDTDPAQARLLDAILAGRSDVTVVGDPRQAIYSFKGADPSLLAGFGSKYPQASVVTLVRDYRSTPEVVAVANRLMRTPEPEALVGQRASGPEPVLLECSSETSEVATVVQRIKGLLAKGVSAAEVAVLYRFNSQGAAFEEALARAGIPYEVVDKVKFFDRPEVVSILRDAWARMRVLEDATGAVPTAHELVLAAAQATGFDPASPPDGAGAARDRWEAVNALLELVASRADAHMVDARTVLLDIAHRRQESHHVALAAVTLSTFHRAKGLEWAHVFMVRMNEGSLPSSYASTSAQLAEEKRVAYVGFTRAAESLTCTRSKTRTSGKRTWPVQPSRYLAEAGLFVGAPETPRGRSASQRRSEPPTELDLDADALGRLEVLTAWRKSTAKTKRMPDFSILSDAQLRAIAAADPQDRQSLLRVKGIGLGKTNAFGEQLLEALAAHRS